MTSIVPLHDSYENSSFSSTKPILAKPRKEVTNDSSVGRKATRNLQELKSYLNERDKDLEATSKWLIHPESLPKLAWDVITMFMILYQSVTIPFKICFNVENSEGMAILEVIITVIFIFDICKLYVVVGYFTGFYQRGVLIMNRRQIAENYLKFWFWFDLIATIPYSWIIDAILGDNLMTEKPFDETSLLQAPQLLRLLKIFKFIRVLKLIRIAKIKRILLKIEDYVASSSIATLLVMFRLVSVIFFIAHWTACWWYFIGSIEMLDNPTTWIRENRIDNKPLFDKYVASLYWSFTTMTTVGYGDIVPFTISEKIYAMFSMVVACGVFAYTIGSIGSLVSKRNAVENAYREQVIAVNRYMRKKSLPQDLQFRVRRYLEYVWEHKKNNNLDEKQILGMLSEPLRDEIYAHIHGVVIRRCKILTEFEEHFISQLSKTLELETYGPGDIVIEEGELSNKLFFIRSGRIDMYHQATASSYTELEPNNYFGEISFFTERARCASARCLDYVDLLTLSRGNMNELLDKFPEAKEKVELLAASCQEDDYRELYVHCYICQELGHVSIKCKKLMLNLNHEDIRRKWLQRRLTSATKYVNPYDLPVPDYERVSRPKKILRYSSRNVKGVPKLTTKMFPEDFGMYPKLKNYIDRYYNRDTASTRHTFNSGENRFCSYLYNSDSEIQYRPRMPRYSLIYKESEESETENSESLDSGSVVKDSYRRYNSYPEAALQQTSLNLQFPKRRRISRRASTRKNSVLEDDNTSKTSEDGAISTKNTSNISIRVPFKEDIFSINVLECKSKDSDRSSHEHLLLPKTAASSNHIGTPFYDVEAEISENFYSIEKQDEAQEYDSDAESNEESEESKQSEGSDQESVKDS